MVNDDVDQTLVGTKWTTVIKYSFPRMGVLVLSGKVSEVTVTAAARVMVRKRRRIATTIMLLGDAR